VPSSEEVAIHFVSMWKAMPRREWDSRSGLREDVSGSIQEYSGVFRSIQEYSGVFRSIQEYSGIFRGCVVPVTLEVWPSKERTGLGFWERQS
jgi:hypothetical protein